MKRSDAYPTKFLSKDDIHFPTVGVIETVIMETLGTGDDQEIKPVMYWTSGIIKPMVINNTNWVNVESIYGDESDNWAGKSVEVWVDPSVSFGGKRTGGLRLRAPASNGAQPSPTNLLTKAQAVTALVAAGLDKAALVAMLPTADDGHKYYVPERDTEKVYELIRQNTPPAEPF
jgi:hypothetical protein